MISKANSSIVQATYPTRVNGTKEVQGNASLSKTEGTDKIKQLKESIDSGTYKVDLEALSKEIAKTLL